MRPSRRALVAGLLILASAGCELITPLDFVGNGADAETRAQEAGEAAAEASSVTGAADGALRPGDGAPNPGDGTTESATTPNPESCQRSPFGCFGGVACGCHSFPSPNDAGPADAVVSANPDSASADSESSTPPPPTNLITNGNFAMGSVYWDLYQQMGGSSSITTPTVTPPQPPQLCVTVPAGASVILGWTPTAGGIMLSPGASYTFSYSAMATPAVIVEAKVGHSYAPYTAEYDGFNTITGTLTAFTSPPFAAPTADAAETSAGIEFTIPETGTVTSAETVCFENVSLVENY